MATDSTARLAPAPKFAAQRHWDCARCGRAEVRPVFVEIGGNVDAYGSGCAARLLGIPASRVRAQADGLALAVDRHEAMLAARRAHYETIVAMLAGEIDEDDRMIEALRTYRATGGADRWGGPAAFAAHVAATGEIG